MRIGVHVSIAGKIYEAIDRASALGCQTIQIFSRNPRGWKTTKLDPNDANEFRRRREMADISPVLVHIPYIINLATPDKNLRKKSINSYIEDLERTDMLGAEYFVTHLGSHVGTGEDNGIKRFAESLNMILQKTKPRCTILLENTAGSGNNLGYKFEHIRKIIKGVKNKKKLGVCLDTQHAYGAGYDISTKNGLTETLKDFNNIIGLERLKAIHLNDSMAKLGSRVDRHQHVGEGAIGKKGLKNVVCHPMLRDLPFIMETPKKKPADDLMNIGVVKGFYK